MGHTGPHLIIRTEDIAQIPPPTDIFSFLYLDPLQFCAKFSTLVCWYWILCFGAQSVIRQMTSCSLLKQHSYKQSPVCQFVSIQVLVSGTCGWVTEAVYRDQTLWVYSSASSNRLCNMSVQPRFFPIKMPVARAPSNCLVILCKASIHADGSNVVFCSAFGLVCYHRAWFCVDWCKSLMLSLLPSFLSHSWSLGFSAGFVLVKDWHYLGGIFIQILIESYLAFIFSFMLTI